MVVVGERRRRRGGKEGRSGIITEPDASESIFYIHSGVRSIGEQ